MAYTVEYNSTENIVESHFQGETTLEELREMARKVMPIVNETNCMNVLTDLSNAYLNTSILDLFYHPQTLAEIIEEAGISFRDLRRAFVIAEDIEKEMFKFYENVAVNRGHTVMLFHDIEEARKWLQQT